MARINIEDTWWTDPRREALSKLVGDELIADGVMVRLWRLAQQYWKNAEPIPNHVFEHVRHRSEVVACSLASVEENGVYVAGSSKAFEWITKAKENASKAGKKSAEKRLLTKGTSQPLPNQTRTPVERNSTEPERNPTKPNDPEPSSSSSSSSSSSYSLSGSGFKKTNAGIRLDYPQEFDAAWLLYERKGDKKRAYLEYKKLNLTKEGGEQLVLAISNYKSSKPDPQFRKDFERFLPTDWREWLTTKNTSNGVHPKTQERVNQFNRFVAREEARAEQSAKEVDNEQN